jgi:hypothetical protein
MFIETKKVLALVALIVATGVTGVELSRGAAQADPLLVTGGVQGYAGARIDGAFELAAAMPNVDTTIPLAEKGDLPAGCLGPFSKDEQAECIDAAYEVESGRYTIVETPTSGGSILTRVMSWAVADAEAVQQGQ